MYFLLFPRVGALKVYNINFRFHIRSSGRSASFVSLFIIIFHNERVILNTLNEISDIN